MDENSNIPLTNLTLVHSIKKHKKEEEEMKDGPKQVVCQTNLEQYVQKELIHDQTETEDFSNTMTSLSYSIDTNQCLEQDTPVFNRNKPEKYLEVHHNHAQVLTQFLACEQEEPESHYYEVNPGGLTEADEVPLDYSEELFNLRAKIVQIQNLAQQQIIRLKTQLQRQKQRKTSVVEPSRCQVIDASTNTEEDIRDDQITILKESIRHQMTLNKQLLQQQISRTSKRVNPGRSNENSQDILNKLTISDPK